MLTFCQKTGTDKLHEFREILTWIHILIGCSQRTTARKTPAISTRKCSRQRLATHVQLLGLGQHLASRILYLLVVGEKARHRQGKILYEELLKSWSTLGHFLTNSPFHGKLQGLPCSSPPATPNLKRAARDIQADAAPGLDCWPPIRPN